MVFELEPADEPCPDCGSEHHRACKEEHSDHQLAWFEDLSKRAQAALYKSIEPLTEQEKKRLGIHE